MTKIGQELINGLNEAIAYEQDKQELSTWDKFIYRGRTYTAEDWNKLQMFLGVLKKLQFFMKTVTCRKLMV